MAAPSSLAICPGSFDPVTNGHVDMIARAAVLFDRLVVAVASNAGKQPWFPINERLSMMRDVVSGLSERTNIEVETFEGLLADYARRRRAVALVRGLRTASEFAEESQMAMMNRHLNGGCDTVFLVPTPGTAYISSRLVKEVAALGGSLEGLVPPVVLARLSGRASPPVIRV